MGVQVEVGEGQDIEQALRQLHSLVEAEYGRPWYKRRYGYYESPSALRRKRRKQRRLRGKGPAFFWRGPRKFRASAPTRTRIGYPELFARTGSTTSAGR